MTSTFSIEGDPATCRHRKFDAINTSLHLIANNHIMKILANARIQKVPPCLPRVQMLQIALFIALPVFGPCINGYAQDQSIRPQIAISSAAKPKVTSGQKIAIVLSANDNLLGKLLEDAIAIQFSNAGYEVVPREQLESVLAKRLAAKSDSTNEAAVSTLDLAKALGADLAVTGAAVLGTSELQSIMVKATSLQMLDVATGKHLVQTLFDNKEGLRLSEVSKSFLDVVNSTKK
jgi:hypothetical protein